MSFGGSVSAMISSIKNNSRRKGISHFDRKGMFSKNSNKKFDELLQRKATAQQLEGIREKIKRDRRKYIIKTTIISIVLITVIYLAFKYLIVSN